MARASAGQPASGAIMLPDRTRRSPRWPNSRRSKRATRTRRGDFARRAVRDHDAAHRLSGRACRSRWTADRHVFPWAGGVGTQVTRARDLARTGSISRRGPRSSAAPISASSPHDGMTYGLAMPGQLYRSKDGFTGFEIGTDLVQPQHASRCAVETGQHAVRVLDPGRRCAGTHPSQPRRSVRRLARLERQRHRSKFSARNDTGKAPYAPLAPSIRSTAYGHGQPIARPGDFRGKQPRLPALRGRRRKRHRDRRSVSG